MGIHFLKVNANMYIRVDGCYHSTGKGLHYINIKKNVESFKKRKRTY